MADVNGLSFLDLQNRVLGRRFPAARRADCKGWLATAYEDVWAARDWTFKRVSLANLSITGGTSTPQLPDDFAEVIDLYDDQGGQLVRLAQEEFEPYAVADVSRGPSAAYMSVNRQLTLTPEPATSATFRLTYRRRLSHRNLAGEFVGGFMTDDSDYPLWDDHHSLLIPRATVIGLIELNDPTFQPFQDEFERQLDRMGLDYEYERPQDQWGAVPWDC